MMLRRCLFFLALIIGAGAVLPVSSAQEKGKSPSYLPKEGQKEFMTADEFLASQAFTGKPVIKKGDPAKGRVIYAVYCTPCHGLKGDGKGRLSEVLDPKPRDHTDGKGKKPGEGMNDRTNEQLFKAIKMGGQGTKKSVYMPAWGHLISEEDIWNLVSYLRAIAVPPYVPPK